MKVEENATVLLVDDDRVHSRILRSRLEHEGFTVVSAHDGREGIEAAKEYSPQVILCDWMMDGMDGLEVCKEIKNDPQLSNIYFILITSLEAVEYRVLGLDSGADDFLSKPVVGVELTARVRAGLRLHRANSRLAELADALQHKQAQLNAELNEAATYLRSQLPPRLEGKICIDYRFMPCQQLGGDCLDYQWLDEHHLLFYVIDVSGHGLSATLPSIALLNNIRTSIHQNKSLQPHHLLAELNRLYPMNEDTLKYFTMWCGIYSIKEQQLWYASAGHPPAVLIPPNAVSIRSLATKGMAIGLLESSVYHTDTCTVPAGSTLLVFSDGIYENPRATSDHDPLQEFISSIACDQATNEDWLEEITAMAIRKYGTQSLPDDVTLLRLRFNSEEMNCSPS